MRKADKVFEQKPSVDALLITSEKNRFYYTGFASTFGYLVMLKEKNYFITDSRYIEMAKILEKDAELIETTGGNAFGLVSDILKQNNVKTRRLRGYRNHVFRIYGVLRKACGV